MDDLITVAEARERFGLTRYKMTSLINQGTIPVYDNPRDGRSQLVRVSEVAAALQPKATPARRARRTPRKKEATHGE